MNTNLRQIGFDNIIPSYEEVREYENTFRHPRETENPWSHCIARFHNDTYSVTFAIWRNDYGRCYEIGLRNLKTDAFQLNQCGSFRGCFTRFVRLARLIQAGRELRI